jgi:glycerol-3-phosphate acyltransferase PlsX
VRLLSVGEETEQRLRGGGGGHDETPEADGVDFIGNVEGRDLMSGDADVVVTDGFTGNVVLKTIEGTARRSPTQFARRPARARGRPRAGCCCGRRSAGSPTDGPRRTGGAILLGLRGLAVVGHGSSGPDGIANAVRWRPGGGGAARRAHRGAPGAFGHDSRDMRDSDRKVV